MKNNNQTIVWIVAALVVLGGAWFLIANPKPNTETATTATSTTPTATPTVSKSKTTTTTYAPKVSTTPKTMSSPAPAPVKVAGYNSLNYLLSLKEPLVCTVQLSTAYTKRSGTVYVAGGMLRGNFTSYINGALASTSMIDDGTYLYAWTKNASTGLKLLDTLSVSGSQIAAHGGIDPSESISFSCGSWAENTSYFTPPTSVTF